MLIWHHLITADMIEACEYSVADGWEADEMLREHGIEARLHVAEVLSRSVSGQHMSLPATDGALAFRLRFSTHYPVTTHGGVLMQTADKRLAYLVGDGRVIESVGSTLAFINNPTVDRYVIGYRLYGFTHH